MVRDFIDDESPWLNKFQAIISVKVVWLGLHLHIRLGMYLEFRKYSLKTNNHLWIVTGP